MSNLTLAQTVSKVQWCSCPLSWEQSSEIIPFPQPGTWVQLLELLSPFCHEEALLLCQQSESEWIAWIPDYGEALLSPYQFCLSR